MYFPIFNNLCISKYESFNLKNNRVEVTKECQKAGVHKENNKILTLLFWRDAEAPYTAQASMERTM